MSYYRMGLPATVTKLVCFICLGVASVKNKPTTCLTSDANDFVMAPVNSKPAHPTRALVRHRAFVIIYYIVACKQALLFGRAKRTARKRARGPHAPLSRLPWGGGGGRVLPYMGDIGMCRCEGYGFQAVYSRTGYINQSVWV